MSAPDTGPSPAEAGFTIGNAGHVVTAGPRLGPVWALRSTFGRRRWALGSHHAHRKAARLLFIAVNGYPPPQALAD